jgi:hypothetical protein
VVIEAEVEAERGFNDLEAKGTAALSLCVVGARAARAVRSDLGHRPKVLV